MSLLLDAYGRQIRWSTVRMLGAHFAQLQADDEADRRVFALRQSLVEQGIELRPQIGQTVQVRLPKRYM